MGGAIYCAAMTILAFQMMTPVGAMVLLSWFYVTITAAWILMLGFEPKRFAEEIGRVNGGRVGSIWCWAASFAPIYNLLVFQLLGGSGS